MSEYISRNEVYQKLHEAGGCDASDEWARGYDAGITKAIDIIDNIPPADVVPVVHGHWKWVHRLESYECSACGGETLCDDWGSEQLTDYCPHCGAIMDESEDEK